MMRFTRLYSTADRPVAEQVEWKTVPAKIAAADGRVIFEMPAVEVPARWSDDAVNILAQKYLRKAGVPDRTAPNQEPGIPLSLCPAVAYKPGSWEDPIVFGPETSARQVFHRMAGCWTYWGWRMGLFDAEDQARIFYDELFLMLARQVGAPNSPQWFNTGLHWAYGIEGPASGQWAIDWNSYINKQEHEEKFHKPYETANAYERPQPHACFLTPVSDDLVNPGGIMDLWVREARIFKGGSGSGVNVSTLRAAGEKLSGGGTVSGVMSWLRIGDSAAGAIQSGGTTRRAAVMRILDIDHPEIENFIGWKVREEAKAAAMYVGSQNLRNYYMDLGDVRRDPYVAVPEAVIDRAQNGFEPEVFGVGWEGEAIKSVDGQNSNNSVRVTNEFMRASAEKDAPWGLTARTTGKVIKTVTADGLWLKICRAAWASADPGLLFHDTINEWNTCAADGVIRTTNPCSEFHHLDGSACNLASLNLVAFQRDDGSLDLDAFEHAARLWTIALDVSVQMASFPAREFALGAYNYRTLGLGYANLGGLLMRSAIPYDSDEGRALAAAITALMTGVAYRTSAELAEALGPFPRWEENEADMRRVLRNHREALIDGDYSDLVTRPYAAISVCIDNALIHEITDRAASAWNEVCAAKSFRNAQVTLLAPTGTISFVMDCGDSTGVEPHFALVAYKNLAGGGTMKIVNQNVEAGLQRLDCTNSQTERALAWIKDHDSLAGLEDPFVQMNRAIFACAGDISPLGHVKMVAAVQPFLSGAVSKTINLPSSVTIADVSQVYREAHRLGVKAIALYRDGSKLNQPLSAKIPPLKTTMVDPKVLEMLGGQTQLRVPIQADFKTLPRGVREYLPWRRERGYTQKVKIGDDGQSLFMTVNSYADGRPAEMYLELGHEGSTLRAMTNLVGVMTSLALQYGAPIGDVVDRLARTKFEPAGLVEGHDQIKFCESIADFVGRDLGITFLEREDLANVRSAVVS
jgi:ribonucleoside-diphosphate reductase alpha chain